MTYFLVGWFSGLAGVVVGAVWRGWVEEGRVKEAQDRRIRLILLGVAASVAAGHGVIHPTDRPAEFIRVADIQPTRVN